MFGKFKRNLKTFVKSGKRFRVVYTTPSWDKANKTVNVYQTDRQYATTYFDKVTQKYLIGVRKK